jgi:hypothetical protein
MTRIPPASLARPITLGAGAGSVTVVFDQTGAITSLKVGSGGVEWAIPERPLAQYVYQTLNDSEWIPWSADYINGGTEEKTQPTCSYGFAILIRETSLARCIFF